jgi:hypothetical protein
MEKSSSDLFHELSFYTLAHPGKNFIHQHIVDAFTAQNANETTKPIAIIFALAGLYLYSEKHYTGRQVQLVHMQMANGKKVWPVIVLPKDRGDITVSAVLAANPGAERDAMIGKWCIAVWNVYKESHQSIASLIRPLMA